SAVICSGANLNAAATQAVPSAARDAIPEIARRGSGRSMKRATYPARIPTMKITRIITSPRSVRFPIDRTSRRYCVSMAGVFVPFPSSGKTGDGVPFTGLSEAGKKRARAPATKKISAASETTDRMPIGREGISTKRTMAPVTNATVAVDRSRRWPCVDRRESATTIFQYPVPKLSMGFGNSGVIVTRRHWCRHGSWRCAGNNREGNIKIAPIQNNLIPPAPVHRDIPRAWLLTGIVIWCVTITVTDRVLRVLGGRASIIVVSGVRAELSPIAIFSNGFISLVVQHSNGHVRAADWDGDRAPAGIRILEAVIFRVDGKYNI